MSGREQVALAPLSSPVIPPGVPERCQPEPTSSALRTMELVQAWSAGLSWYWGSPVAAAAAAHSASAAKATTAMRRAGLTLLSVHVAAEHHERLDGFGHEGGRLVGVRERVGAGPRRLGAAATGRIDLGLDDARVAVVDGAENRDRTAVAACMPDEQLARSGGRLGHEPTVAAALRAACPTVSLSAKPLIRAASVEGLT